ncbi:MAG TPA: hypothetical protein PLB12_11350 [Candidatus Goldiibacteriota bacterium]|nr:hypothetical protein [Candidatus Goldiibacteriota bacterium]HPN64947.1 hypothetical protein [Candidatus Goldiibacteriota bacterium]HRQ44930.1 hypothetical protein [Candidatus Goldiibacteriota bacterium]
MKKGLLVLMAIALFCGAVFATESRVGGLGIPSWAVTSDDSLSKDFIAREAFNGSMFLITHSNALDLNVTDIMMDVMLGKSINLPYTTTAQINVNLGPGVLSLIAENYKGVLGMAVTGPELSSQIEVGSGDPFSGNMMTTGDIGLPKYNFRAGYSVNLEGLAIGGGVNLAMASASEKSTEKGDDASNDNDRMDIKGSSLDLGFEAGASMEKKDDGIGFDLGIKLNLPSIANEGKEIEDDTDAVRYDETLKSTAGLSLEAAGRVLAGPVIVGAKFASKSITTEFQIKEDYSIQDGTWDENDTMTSKVALTDITGGIAFNLQPNEKASIMPGIAFVMSTTNFEFESVDNISSTEGGMDASMSSMSIPVFVSAESKLTDTFAARVGISKVVFDSEKVTFDNEGDGMEVERANLLDDISVSGGITFNLGDLTIDGVITGGLAASGLSVITTGMPFDSMELRIPGGVFTSLSAKYKF